MGRHLLLWKKTTLRYQVRGTPVPTTRTHGTNYPESTGGACIVQSLNHKQAPHVISDSKAHKPHPLSDQPAPATQNLAVTLDAQVLFRDTKVIDKRLREAYLFGCPASLERFEVTPDRGITQDRIDRLATCEWINHGQDLIIVGATGTGKSYLAKGLGVAACRSKLTARYYRLNELTDDFDTVAASPTGRKQLLEELTQAYVADHR